MSDNEENTESREVDAQAVFPSQGTNKEEIRQQFRRLEKNVGQDVELKQTQTLLGIHPVEKPSPNIVEDCKENYFTRHWGLKYNEKEGDE